MKASGALPPRVHCFLPWANAKSVRHPACMTAGRPGALLREDTAQSHQLVQLAPSAIVRNPWMPGWGDTQCMLSPSDTGTTPPRHLHPALLCLRSIFTRTQEHDLPSCPGCDFQNPFWVLPGEWVSQEHKQTSNGYQSKSASQATPRLICSENYTYWLKLNKQ